MPRPHDAGPIGHLVLRDHDGRPFLEAKWRDSTRAQRKRRIGPAWLERNAGGEWVKRSGRVKPGFFDDRRAYLRMTELIAEHEERLRLAPGNRRATFDDAAAAWLEYLEHELRVKPSTLRDYRYMLADPRAPQRRRGGKRERSARIMKAFGGRELSSITTADVRRFLSTLDHADVSARTVNKFRATLHALFEYAMRSEAYGLRVNPARDTKKRPEGGAKPIDTFEPAEVRLIAKAAREGLHRDRPDHNFSPETVAAWQRSNERDAAIIVVAAFAGLRLGELLALRWKDVDLTDADRRLTVVRAVSAGQEVTSTKSRHFRVVPLSEQPAAELRRLSQRGHFTGRSDLVFCRKDGGALDGSALRHRFLAAQDAAGVRRRRFHDLRHTFGSLAVRSFDPVAVQSMMGHSSLLTTQRYLHSRPRADDAAKLTQAFS
jgi:integrase